MTEQHRDEGVGATLPDYCGEEKRTNWSYMDKSTLIRLFGHMAEEEEKFKKSDERMTAIEKDLQPIKKLYWATVGSAGIGALLLALLIYIYSSDKNDDKEMKAAFKEVQNVIIIQGEAIKMLMTSQQNLERSSQRDVDRLERNMTSLLNQSERRNDSMKRSKP